MQLNRKVSNQQVLQGNESSPDSRCDLHTPAEALRRLKSHRCLSSNITITARSPLLSAFASLPPLPPPGSAMHADAGDRHAMNGRAYESSTMSDLHRAVYRCEYVPPKDVEMRDGKGREVVHKWEMAFRSVTCSLLTGACQQACIVSAYDDFSIIVNANPFEAIITKSDSTLRKKLDEYGVKYTTISPIALPGTPQSISRAATDPSQIKAERQARKGRPPSVLFITGRYNVSSLLSFWRHHVMERACSRGSAGDRQQYASEMGQGVGLGASNGKAAGGNVEYLSRIVCDRPFVGGELQPLRVAALTAEQTKTPVPLSEAPTQPLKKLKNEDGAAINIHDADGDKTPNPLTAEEDNQEVYKLRLEGLCLPCQVHRIADSLRRALPAPAGGFSLDLGPEESCYAPDLGSGKAQKDLSRVLRGEGKNGVGRGEMMPAIGSGEEMPMVEADGRREEEEKVAVLRQCCRVGSVVVEGDEWVIRCRFGA
ncbi:unnamed protein product [Vitrella brassicaformis CCMP3155]|uniref:Uncharacterized protein n=1 Tax=Vitrella brassicaformis (strain CCMP3155) TaxID=1169540 RepID=A0A0G4E8X9_VITBC|nr:unnamed protein product [Vitrella brassicaformis CCMP3155]|eukprot:CEL91652.1 unnamed protein product [Vitrella brassicaformis CCMP3155]